MAQVDSISFARPHLATWLERRLLVGFFGGLRRIGRRVIFLSEWFSLFRIKELYYR